MIYPDPTPTTKIKANSTDPIWLPGKNEAVLMYPKNIARIIGIVRKPQIGQTAIINLMNYILCVFLNNVDCFLRNETNKACKCTNINYFRVVFINFFINMIYYWQYKSSIKVHYNMYSKTHNSQIQKKAIIKNG